MRAVRLVFVAVVLAVQCALALHGVADMWTRGHNGWNGAAYHNAARNAERWDTVFPVQYATENQPPKPADHYTHAPLGLHAHLVASVKTFGDHEASIRGVAAAYAVLVVLALLFVVSRLWSPWTGAIAAAVYVALPINAIYTNMPNHTAGFVIGALGALFFFVRSRTAGTWHTREFLGLLLSIVFATLWDWPAYTLALVVAVWWFVSILVGRSRGTQISGDVTRWTAFCAVVLAMFAGHFALVHHEVGNIDELLRIVSDRRYVKAEEFKHHLSVVPALMFTWSVLAMAGAWLIAWVARTSAGHGAHRDIVPLAFFVAAVTHYFLFRQSATEHSYWAWPALPFVAIAVSTTGVALFKRTRLGTAAWCIALAVLIHHSVTLVPQARAVGGSLWFTHPVRGPLDKYDSGKPALTMAQYVRDWSDRETALQLHTSLKHYRLEPRFDITADRPVRTGFVRPKPATPPPKGSRGWMFIAPTASLTETMRDRLAKRYRYRELGEFTIVDMRHAGVDVQLWRAHPGASSVLHRFVASPFEPPLSYKRDPADEAALLSRLGEVDMVTP